jgi:epoxyqueuosine reductase
MLNHIVLQHTTIVKQEATKLGFDFCGISNALFLEEEAKHLENWLNKNHHGNMAYMANHFDKRLDPRLLVPGAKSIISLMINYFPDQTQVHPDAPKISKYAYGPDYHEVIRKKLNALIETLRAKIGDIEGRAFVDSAPVMDKAWAKKSGMGWMGKNTNIIHKNKGSFFFIAELITDLELIPDGSVKDYCGTCTRCIEACPTDALLTPYNIDASKCISYLTIELKEEIPSSFKGQFENWAFGCDICQDVCPWNRFSKAHQQNELNTNIDLLGMTKNEWNEITEEVFNKVFNKSAVKRTKFKGLRRNISFISSS